MKLGKKNAMETGTFMAYACSCNCWCACTCNNCQSIGSANGKQVASNTQTSTTQVKKQRFFIATCLEHELFQQGRALLCSVKPCCTIYARRSIYD